MNDNANNSISNGTNNGIFNNNNNDMNSINNGVDNGTNNSINNNMNNVANSNINGNNISNLPKNNKMLLIVIGIIIVITVVVLALFIFIKPGDSPISAGSHSNTTGLSDYSESDVDYNCSQTISVQLENSSRTKTTTTYVDILFNHKNYEAVVYNKAIIEYSDGVISDDTYEKYIKDLSLSDCDITVNGVASECASKVHIESDTSTLGLNTTIDRSDNQIMITYVNYYGAGKKVTEEAKQVTVSSYRDQGYICK